LEVPHLYKNCVLLFIAFYAAVIEFAFGVLERGMTESEPSVCDVWEYVVMWKLFTVC
jgi:hypothetical protein